MVHPCGSGAFGYFETTVDMSDLTKVRNRNCLMPDTTCVGDFLSGKGVRTPIFMWFSTVTVGRGFPDFARNSRGFAIESYTGKGNYDIVGLNWVSRTPIPSK